MDGLLSPSSDKDPHKYHQYDCQFIKQDVDFDAQTLLNQHRSTLINDHFDVSCLEKHTIQFPKRARAAHSSSSSSADDKGGGGGSTDDDKVKLLQFDCDFESGNIGDVAHYKDCEYDATIRGDTANPRHSVWFYFRVRGGMAGNKVVVHFSNYSKCKSLYSEGFTPLIRSKSRPIWTRLPEHSVSWFKCNRHRRSCFTVSFVFGRSGDEYFFAYSFPYTYSYLQKWLGDIEAMQLPFVKRQLLARSVQQRRLDCLRVEEEGPGLLPLGQRPAVVISSRVHPGETPSSFVMDGLIEFLLSSHESAILLRRKLTLFIVPMLNPDGVFLGNYRCTALGMDMNRHWHHPDFTRHPTICALKFLLRKLDAGNRLDFYLDLHGHTNSTDAFMYCNQSEPALTALPPITSNPDPIPPPISGSGSGSIGSAPSDRGSGHNSSGNNSKNPSVDEPTSRLMSVLSDTEKMRPHSLRNDLTTILPRLLALHCAEYSFSKTKFCNNPKKAGSARRAMAAILSGIPLCYTFEVSFWRSANGQNKHSTMTAQHDKATRGGQQLYTPETYRNQGRCMVLALADIYKVEKQKRGHLESYNFSKRRLMKGDLRKKLHKFKKQKAARQKAKEEAAKSAEQQKRQKAEHEDSGNTSSSKGNGGGSAAVKN